MSGTIVVVGSINLDLVAAAPNIPVAGETISGTSFQTFPGGKGANQAVAASRLGHCVHMVGKVGNDAFGAQLRANLETAGVQTNAVETANTTSGIAQIVTAANGENVIVVVPGANAEVSPLDLDKHIEVIQSADMVLAQLEIPMETMLHLGEIVRREDLRLMLDPAPAQAIPELLLRSVEWLTPNESEACILLGLPVQALRASELGQCADKLLGRCCRNVALKLGKRGCYLALSSGERISLPAYEVKAVDSTAAGDAFNGAFAVALSEGKDAVESATWASAVAAISVTRVGAQPSMPTREMVAQFVTSKGLLKPTRE